VLRTLGLASAATAVLALAIGALREPIVHLVLSASFAPVVELMPLQLVGDVFRVAGWILGMALVGALRTHWFVAVVLLWALVFVGGTRVLVPVLGIEGALWAYLAAGMLQTALAAWALRDRLLRP
jgi:PST family polysaccharide transporter